MKSQHIIMCIDSDKKILKKLQDKISKVIDNTYIIYTYTTAEEALVHSFENIANGFDILMTISSYDFSSKGSERFLVDFHKHSPYTKNVLFSTNLNTEIISEIINKSSIYKIISKDLDVYDFELMILDTIKVHEQERRLREYQNILEDAVDKRTQELKDINIKLQVLATTDSLTGIKNRRSFFDSSEPMISYAKREKNEFAIVKIDLDNFKYINDTFGHDTGDTALKLIVNTLIGIVRKSDILGRIGGEEFAISLPSTSSKGLTMVANKIISAINDLPFTNDDGVLIALSASAGATMLSDKDENLDDIMARSDEALEEAKSNGGNQVVFSQ